MQLHAHANNTKNAQEDSCMMMQMKTVQTGDNTAIHQQFAGRLACLIHDEEEVQRTKAANILHQTCFMQLHVCRDEKNS